MKVGFVSLGCSKNLIDTEVTIGIFKQNNFEIVNDPKEAEIIVINTCGFINSAKEEAINTIIEMAEYKKNLEELNDIGTKTIETNRFGMDDVFLCHYTKA